jgi:hypothetical protein
VVRDLTLFRRPALCAVGPEWRGEQGTEHAARHCWRLARAAAERSGVVRPSTTDLRWAPRPRARVGAPATARDETTSGRSTVRRTTADSSTRCPCSIASSATDATTPTPVMCPIRHGMVRGDHEQLVLPDGCWPGHRCWPPSSCACILCWICGHQGVGSHEHRERSAAQGSRRFGTIFALDQLLEG